MKLILDIEEVRQRLNVDEIEIEATERTMDTSGNFKTVRILHRKEDTYIQVNQIEFKEKE